MRTRGGAHVGIDGVHTRVLQLDSERRVEVEKGV